MRLLAAVSGTTVQYNFSLYNTALYCTVNAAIWLADASWNENIIQIVDGEESNTENIGRRNSCIGRGVAESNTAFLRPIFSVLDDSPSTNCYILIPLHTRRPKLLRQAVRHFDKNNDCSLEARSGVPEVNRSTWVKHKLFSGNRKYLALCVLAPKLELFFFYNYS